MAITLTDLVSSPGPNPGGGVNLYLIDVANVTAIPDPDPSSKSIDTDITVEVGTGFKKFEFAPGTCRLSNPTVGEDGSISFDTLIDVIIDGDDAERLDLFEQMVNGRFIALFDPASTNMKVVGTLRAPLLLRQANYDSGADNPDRNAVTFQFKSRVGHLPKVYTGAIPTGA